MNRIILPSRLFDFHRPHTMIKWSGIPAALIVVASPICKTGVVAFDASSPIPAAIFLIVALNFLNDGHFVPLSQERNGFEPSGLASTELFDDMFHSLPIWIRVDHLSYDFDL